MDDFSLLDAVSVPVIVLERSGDNEARYVFCNRTSCALTGLTRDEMIGRTAIDIFGERLGRAVMRNHLDGLDKGGAHVAETVLPTTAGEVIIRQVFRPVPSDPARVVGTTVSRTSLQAEAQALDSAARAAEQEIELATRAHALRGPMRHLSFLIDDLRRDFTDLGNGKVDLIDQIAALGDQAYDFLRQVLTYTRAVAEMPARPERVSLQMMCHPLFALMDPDDRHVLTAQSQDVLVERRVAEFALREILGRVLSQDGRVSVTVGAHPAGGGQIAIGIACDHPAPCAASAVADMPDLDRVLRTRGGSLECEATGDGSLCRVTLPGRVFDSLEQESGPPVRRAAS